ncbi:MAG: metallophosphoesterase family protein [Verrucomicrobia bacterium]|jgi:hypothetical protein|nr:metallophosphoesterase family protein [Verrucomicrobiota bacterium]
MTHKTPRSPVGLIAVCSLILAGTGLSTTAQSVILTGITAPWRYNTNNLDGVEWTDPGYDDSAWSGPSNALLYIESQVLPAPKNTALPPKPAGGPWNTYYFRSTFSVPNAGSVGLLTFTNLIDDGVVFYLNGVEVQRIGMSAGVVNNGTLSSRVVDNATSYDVFTLSGDVLTNLVEGDNVLAAEVHQQASTSTDIVFGCAVSAYYGEPPVALTRGPYLQLSTPDSVVIRWRTSVPAGSRVIYGTNLASLVHTNLDTAGVTEHEVVLSNLLPDTRYVYAIGTAATNLAGADSQHFFWTHPLPGTPKSIRVWVIGDAGTAGYGLLANQIAVRNAFEAYHGTNTLHAWLQLGDNAYPNGTDLEYQAAVFNVYTNQLRTSVTWPALGNHETYGGAPYPYFALFTLPAGGEAGGVPSGTEHYYSFDLGMVHFICLDSMIADRATNGAMATWLRSDLEVNTQRWTVAFWHHPPYTKGSHNSDTESELVQMRQNFLPILEAGGVDLVLTGHSHSYERSYLIDGHYGLSTTFNTNTMLVQPGTGRETNGVGAYLKPDGLGETPVGHRGAVYAVAGSSGQISGGLLNHPVMVTSQNVLGSMVLDFQSNRLDAVFLRETGVVTDWFSLIKEGTHPPVLTNAAVTPVGDFQFSVLCRAYRTNVIEASDTPDMPSSWTGLATNVPLGSTFEYVDASVLANPRRCYRVRQP